MYPQRNNLQKILDFFTFPLRALTLFENNRFGLSSLRSERFDYVSREVTGRCLDVGCGKNNIFITEYVKNEGNGIDVFPYEGLTDKELVKDITHFPFPDREFESCTFIASINHIPRNQRLTELKEAYRCLKMGGTIIITMGNPLAEIIVHKLTHFYSTIIPHFTDMDTERGMHHDEDYYLTDVEIIQLLRTVGFKKIKKIYFYSQWLLNHLFVGLKN